MLVLARKAGQRIVIGDNVVVSIVEIRGSTVRLGIEAPRYLPVFRDELLVQKTTGCAECVEAVAVDACC